VLAFTYDNTDKAGAGTIGITFPAGFSAPQDGNARGRLPAGRLTVRHVQDHRDHRGRRRVHRLVRRREMRTRLGGVLLYSRVSVPKTAGSYPSGASFTPSGSSAATPFGALSATVRPAAPVSLQVSPATAPGGGLHPGRSDL